MPPPPSGRRSASAAPIARLESELDALGTAPFPVHEWLINLRLEFGAPISPPSTASPKSFARMTPCAKPAGPTTASTGNGATPCTTTT
jgi:hypothetical protein